MHLLDRALDLPEEGHGEGEEELRVGLLCFETRIIVEDEGRITEFC